MWVALYYYVIIAWAFFYTFASMTDSLAWAGCDNWFNSPDCFLPDLAKECEVGTTLWNNNCTRISLYCQARGVETALNTRHCAQNITVESPTTGSHLQRNISRGTCCLWTTIPPWTKWAA